jgi:uncharacterized peroxidase-related enzyme
MRLELFHNKQKIVPRLIFQIVRLVEGWSPDIVRMFLYRQDYFGKLFQPRFHETMRGDSEWTAGERELMAALVSSKNQCRYCTAAHQATAGQLVDDATAAAVVATPATAPVSEKLRVMLAFLEKLTLSPEDVTADDVAKLRSAGISDDGIVNAAEVCAQFCIINRLADTFGFRMQTPEGLAKEAKSLATKHYKFK